MSQCKARSKQTGEQCKRRPVPGREVCSMHGGKTPVGIALPQTTHGRYSKYLPVRLMERFEEAQNDSELLAIRSDIALLDARIHDVLTRVDTGESGELWERVRDALRAYKAAGKEEKEEALEMLSLAIEHGVADRAAWREVRLMLQEKRKLVEAELRRLSLMQQMIPIERANMLFAAITASIRRNVTDAPTLRALSEDLRRIVTHDSGGYA